MNYSKKVYFASALLILLIIGVCATNIAAQQKANFKLNQSLAVLEDFSTTRTAKIPSKMLRQAEAVVIIPKLKKAGFVVGGKTGKGIVMMRQLDGSWSDPVFVKLSGLSLGFQVGYNSTDIFLVIKDASHLQKLFEQKGAFSIGGDATIAAGPLGREASAATNLDFDTGIFSYSKSRGVFAGISLEGADLRLDKKLNRDYYGSNDQALAVLSSEISSNKNIMLKDGLWMMENGVYH